MKILFLFFFLLSLNLTASKSLWIGYGIITDSKEDYQRESPVTSKFINWGFGKSFFGPNLLYFESGYGLPEGRTFDDSETRTSYVKAGYERHMTMLNFQTYAGIAPGAIIRTVNVDQRSTNWKPNDPDYEVTGIRKRSSVTYMIEANLGARFLRNLIPGISFDWNVFSLIYNEGKFRFMTALTLVYIKGD